MAKIFPSLLFTILTLVVCTAKAQQKDINPQKNTIVTTKPDTAAQALLTASERQYAIRFLQETQAGVFSTIRDLSEAQLTFKPGAEQWSIADCVKHIAAAEQNLWAMVAESLAQPANPDERAGIKFSDDALVNAVKDRSHKSKTFAALEPANSPFKTVAEALGSFKENREKLIAYVGSTREDLRNHVSVLPIGTYDAYQFILLISAHSNRHTQQMEAVKASVGFPKK